MRLQESYSFVYLGWLEMLNVTVNMYTDVK